MGRFGESSVGFADFGSKASSFGIGVWLGLGWLAPILGSLEP